MKNLYGSIAIIFCVASNTRGRAGGGGRAQKIAGMLEIATLPGKVVIRRGREIRGNQTTKIKIKWGRRTPIPIRTPGKKGSGSNSNDHKKMGDSNFDKNGIGSMDEKKFSDQKGNKWRYEQRGHEWWYWQPAGYWCYWRDGRWCHYDENTYVEVAVAGHGPFYEDRKRLLLPGRQPQSLRSADSPQCDVGTVGTAGRSPIRTSRLTMLVA